MGDSHAVLDAERDKSSIDTAIASWRSSTAPTGVDSIDVTANGRNRVLITINYTA